MRKPQALKVLQGTDRPCRNYPEPEFPAPASTDPPDWLAGPEAVAEWGRIVGILDPARVLTAGDLTLLGHLCNMHDSAVRRWRSGLAPLAADLTQLRLVYAEFGLTPASRSKAGVVPKDQKGNAFTRLKSG
jgi:phage terminase small subunit